MDECMTICTAPKIGMKLDQTFQNPLWPAWECTDADAELNWLTALQIMQACSGG